MLYHFLYPLNTQLSVLSVMQYITFRTAAASLTAFVFMLVLGPWVIRTLRNFQIGQVVRHEGPETHRPKAGTPTMGGLLILGAAIMPTLLWVDLTNLYVWVAVLSTLAFGAVGFIDDYLKVVRGSHHGLRPRYKFTLQCLIAAGVGLALLSLSARGLYNTQLVFPFFKGLMPDLGWWYVPFAVLVLVGSSNAVNLTDGLDGLAISVFTISAVVFHGSRLCQRSRRLRGLLAAGAVPASRGVDGLLWVVGRFGAWIPLVQLLPCRDIHGRCGSLALGGALGTVALLIKQELLLPIVGAVFVIEALSVIIQVAAFKVTGQRVFRMAPLHHHCELIGWSEPKVIIRFLIAAVVFALFSLTTLKLR